MRRPSRPLQSPSAGPQTFAGDRAGTRDPAAEWFGFPVRITGGDGTAGYTAVEVQRHDGATADKVGGWVLTAANPGFPLGDTAFAEGDLALARPGPGTGGLQFELVPVGRTAADAAADAAATDCRASAGWDEDTCLTWAVPAAGVGRCASVPPQGATPLAWDADAGGTGVGGWVGVSPLSTDRGAEEVRIWREKGELVGTATYDGEAAWLTRQAACRDGKVVFVGSRELCIEDGEEASATCGDHTFEIEVGCDVCADAGGVVTECGSLPPALCATIERVDGEYDEWVDAFLRRLNGDGDGVPTPGTPYDQGGTFPLDFLGYLPFWGFTSLPTTDLASDNGFFWELKCSLGAWRLDFKYGPTTNGLQSAFPTGALPWTFSFAEGAYTITVAEVPAEGCGTGAGAAPDGSDAGGDYGGLCDAVLGVGGPAVVLDLLYATAASPHGPKAGVGWDAATATQMYTAPGGSPAAFTPATPGPANRMVFYVRSGVAYLGVWEGRLPPVPFDPTDADYTAAADADPTCGAACFEAVFTDATLLTYAPAVTGGEIVVGTPGGCVPAACDCGTVLEVGTPATGDDTPGEWLACVTIPADGTYRLCGEILTGSGAYFTYTDECDGTTFTGRAIESGDGMLGLTIGTRTAGEVVYFRVLDSGGYGAATFTFKVVAGGTC